MDRDRKIKLSYRLALVSGVFCAMLSLLLIINFWNLKQNNSPGSASIKELVDRLNQAPGNEELKQEILSLDLMARKACLTSCWQIKTGTCLLLIAGIILAISLKIYTELRSRTENPEGLTREIMRTRSNSQYWLFLGGGLALGLAFSAAFLSNDILKDYKQLAAAAETIQAKGELEVIQLSPPAESSKAGDEIVKDEVNAIPANANPANATRAFSGIEDLKRNHNSFRGFFGQGISFHQNIPVNWSGSSGQNVKWKVACSMPGSNSPVIWGDRLFISGADSRVRIVSCYQRFTGQLLWEREAKNIQDSPAVAPEEYPETGLAAPTMAVDGHRVYAIFGTGDLVAFDLEGSIIWSRNLGVPANPYNHSSSLIVWQEKLVVQYDTQARGRMLTVNTATGETIWDITRPVHTSWTSPVLIRLNEKIQILTSADPYVSGYDMETGAELWKVEGMTGEVAASVAFDDGLVFANAEYARLICIKPEPGASYIWEDDEYLSSIPSPVAFEGLLYVPTNYGDLVCYDAKTGEKYWEKWLEDEIYSSPMIADGKLYLIDKGGTMHILKADTTGTMINEPELGEGGYATPAFADGLIYLRGTRNLYCIGE